MLRIAVSSGRPLRLNVRFALVALVGAIALSGCQQQATPTFEGALQVAPAAATVAPGSQQQFTAQSPWGSDVTWAVSLPTCGTITASGLFTASLTPTEPSGICTVVATLKSDPSKVGLAVVIVQIEPPVTAVSASGQQQAADGLSVESVVAEPVSAVTAVDASGTVENRSGFYPSGSAGTP